FRRSSRLAGETVDLGQSKTRSLAGLFGREEWIEGPGQNFGRHSTASVFYRYRDILARLQLGLQTLRDAVENGCLYCEKSAIGHCIPRIDGKVEQHQLQLGRIDQCRPEVLFRDHVDPNGGSQSSG